MKSKYIIYPSILLLAVGAPVLRYYWSTPGMNACVLEYVDNMEKGNYDGYIYNIKWVNHIEPANSKLVDSLSQYKVWESKWCLMVSNNMVNDLNNTFYCTMTYLIKNAPMDNQFKKPLKYLDIGELRY